MSCEYGQTRSEDKNMEADRNKRGLGERQEREREREMQATGVPKCWRDCAGMVARGLSAEWAPLPLFPPSDELHAGDQMLGSVFDTHVRTVRHCCSHAAMLIYGCVCQCLHVFARFVSFKSQAHFLYLVLCLPVCIPIVYYFSWEFSDHGTKTSLNLWDFLQCLWANCVWYNIHMI